MLFEIAWIAENGDVVRGGVAATARTVGRWIEEAVAEDPDTFYVAVPASEEAVLARISK